MIEKRFWGFGRGEQVNNWNGMERQENGMFLWTGVVDNVAAKQKIRLLFSKVWESN